MKRTLGGLLLFLAVSWSGGTPTHALSCHHSDDCTATCFMFYEEADESGRCHWTLWGAQRDLCGACDNGVCAVAPCDEPGQAVTNGKVDLERSSLADCDPAAADVCAGGEQCGLFDDVGACITLQS